MANRETVELEAEHKRLENTMPPDHWDQRSWMRGAMYALALVINRRGAALAPFDAAQAYVREDQSKPGEKT